MTKHERSLKAKLPGEGRGDKRWPSGLDIRDPEGVASFGLSLGYDEENVVQALVHRCSLDRITARSIVRDVAQQQGGTP